MFIHICSHICKHAYIHQNRHNVFKILSVIQGRNGKGSIYVWAGGNGGLRADSCAADGYINSIYTIAAGAVDEHGIPAYYDEMCSAKMIVTFNYNSSRGKHVVNITHACTYYKINRTTYCQL